MHGIIIKAIAGFYYIDAGESGIYACRARGIFRKEGITPLVGDRAEFDITDEKDREGNVTRICERRNQLRRPMCANIDEVLIVAAHENPKTASITVDKLLIEAERARIPAVIALNKSDKSDEDVEAIGKNLEACNYKVFRTSPVTGEGLDELKREIAGKTTVLAGTSGVGKSSIANYISGDEIMETGEISAKLGRGKNTTRHSQLIPIPGGGHILDTPGFSAFDTEIDPSKLAGCFPEMRKYLSDCYFTGCTHTSEPDCAVKSAVENGLIPEERYKNYKIILDEELQRMKRRYK